jgi:protein SCO1
MNLPSMLAMILLLLPGPAFGYSTVRLNNTDEFRFDQHPGTPLPLNSTFRDEAGAQARLGDYFRGKPVVLILEYLHCKTLCGFVMQDTAEALSQVPLAPGRDYRVLAISIDPRDNEADARAAHAKLRDRFGADAAAGWDFLTGSAADIAAVAQAVGFPYRYDPGIDQYVHPAGITVATPTGTISRYILGVGYRPLDLRLGISEAGAGSVSSPAAEILLLCYCYDPANGRYSFAIQNVMRALGAGTVLAIGLIIAKLSRARRA